jgi:hypothetical protein
VIALWLFRAQQFSMGGMIVIFFIVMWPVVFLIAAHIHIRRRYGKVPR